jgi:hypothetical protein
MENQADTKSYHIEPAFRENLHYADRARLEKWANDPNCIEREACVQFLEQQQAVERERLAEKRRHLEENPFDPRTEVSADGRRIVVHLWIIFVLLPFVFGLLYLFVRGASSRPYG